MNYKDAIDRGSLRPILDQVNRNEPRAAPREAGGYTVFVNSKKRLSGESSYFDYNIDIPKYQVFTHVVVKQIQIPSTYYMIDDEYTFIISEDAVDNTVTLTRGNYTAESLRLELENKLNLVTVNTYNVMYPATTDIQTYRYTITSTGAATTVYMYISSVRIRELLGMNVNNTFTGAPLTLVSPNAATTAVEQSMRLISDICNEDTLIDIVDLNIGGGTVTWSSHDILSDSRTINNHNSNTFTFRLVNEDNVLIKLNGPDMSFILYLY